MSRMANQDRISVEPDVMGGKPCIKSTRIPVDLILRYLGDGQSVEDILAAFPGLTVEDVRAAERSRASRKKNHRRGAKDAESRGV